MTHRMPPSCPSCLAEPPGSLYDAQLPEGGRWSHDCTGARWIRQRPVPRPPAPPRGPNRWLGPVVLFVALALVLGAALGLVALAGR